MTYPLILNAFANNLSKMSNEVSSGSTDIFLYSGCIIPSHFYKTSSMGILWYQAETLTSDGCARWAPSTQYGASFRGSG